MVGRGPSQRLAAEQVLAAQGGPVAGPGDGGPHGPLQLAGSQLHAAQLRGGLVEPGPGGRGRLMQLASRGGRPSPGRGMGRCQAPVAQLAADDAVGLPGQGRDLLGEPGQLPERLGGITRLRPAAARGRLARVQEVLQPRRAAA